MHSASKLLVSSPAVPCLDATVNARMKAQVEALVRVVEGRKKCRVVSCATEFSVDRQGRAWLLRTVSCVTAVDGPALNRRPVGEMKAARNVASSGVGQALTLATVEAGPGGEAHGGRRKTGAHVGGGNTQERAQRRRAREGAPDEEAVQRVLAELDVTSSQRLSHHHHRGRDGGGAAESSSKSAAAPPVVTAELKDAHHEPTTTMDLRQVASSAAASKALGSTQLSGCPGDFCGKGGHSVIFSSCAIVLYSSRLFDALSRLKR